MKRDSRIIYCLQKAQEAATAAMLWCGEAENAVRRRRKPRTVVRSAVTGKFASKAAAKRAPRETVRERR